MKIQDSLEELRRFAQIKEINIDALSPEQAIQLMADFYAEVRADECDVQAEGDMLLYQWGEFNWGEGEAFEFNITRQFMQSDEDDDLIFQLSLTLRYPPTDSFRRLEAGNQWCGSPDGIKDFLEFMQNSEALQLCGSLKVESVELRLGRV